LTRTTRSVSPTKAGERLLHTAGPRFKEIQAELKAVSELRDKPAGTIRITAVDYAAETVLWPKLAKLLREYRRADQSGPTSIATSAIQRAWRRARRSATASPSKSVGTRSSMFGSTPSRQLTLTTA
jgi:DNA-binding transcriptional LysR family regulator